MSSATACSVLRPQVGCVDATLHTGTVDYGFHCGTLNLAALKSRSTPSRKGGKPHRSLAEPAPAVAKC